MAEAFSPELKKLMSIAQDATFSAGMRAQAIGDIARNGTYQALLALLELAADKKAAYDERDLALVHARELIKAPASK